MNGVGKDCLVSSYSRWLKDNPGEMGSGRREGRMEEGAAFVWMSRANSGLLILVPPPSPLFLSHVSGSKEQLTPR